MCGERAAVSIFLTQTIAIFLLERTDTTDDDKLANEQRENPREKEGKKWRPFKTRGTNGFVIYREPFPKITCNGQEMAMVGGRYVNEHQRTYILE